MAQSNEPLNELWEMAEFCAREAHALRSFLEYLLIWPDTPEKKWERLQGWRQEVGLQLGNPQLADPTKELFQKLRDAPPEVQKTILQANLAALHSGYFPST